MIYYILKHRYLIVSNEEWLLNEIFIFVLFY